MKAGSEHPELALQSEGVERHLWRFAFGELLIEVQGKDVRVNGRLVEPYVDGQDLDAGGGSGARTV